MLPSMTNEQLADLKERADRLAKILNEPWEEGLFAWQGAVNDLWFDVVQWAPSAAYRRLRENEESLDTRSYPVLG